MKNFYCVFLVMALMALGGNAAPSRDSDAAEDGDDIEGDIIKRPDESGKFSMLQHEFYKWPNNIVYFRWASGLSSSQKSIVKQAMQDVEDALNSGGVCIEFQKATAENLYYIFIQNGGGCAAGIGRWPSYQTPVYIGSSCTTGNMMHELLHTLGLYHEQSRNDRDDYITINTENIRAGYESNFDKAGAYVYDQGSHYDYDSIMHYRSTSFTKDGSDTISVPEGVTTVIGQRDHLSDCDIERIQVHYGCKAKVEICAKSE